MMGKPSRKDRMIKPRRDRPKACGREGTFEINQVDVVGKNLA
jgi:hypothetical protein